MMAAAAIVAGAVAVVWQFGWPGALAVAALAGLCVLATRR